MDERRSQHPVDILLRAIITGRHGATEEDVAAIMERMATAPFDPRVVPVRRQWRGLSYLGYELGAHEPSAILHLALRVKEDRQWVVGTTGKQLDADLRVAVRTPGARIAVYERRGGHLVAVLVVTRLVIPAARRGERTLDYLLVVYSADRGIILTGYQCSSLATAAIPEDARWLR